MKFILCCLLLNCLTVHAPAQSSARPLLVATASDLQFVMPDLIAVYEKAHPEIKISPTYGASGKFYEQIKNGAPFDLFLSADAALPEKLIEASQAEKADFFLYAVGHLVVWVSKTSALDFDGKGMQALLDPTVKKIAIANPAHAPYGRAAVAAMQKLGVYEAVQDRMVLGENVVQAAQFAETGAADAALIGLSVALAPKMMERGRYWEVPSDAFPKLEQGGVVLREAKNAAEARKFRDWLRTEEVRAVLKKYGFALPEA